jgi:hypothetical protein
MQLFVRNDDTVIAAPVQCDVDGIPKRSHLRESIRNRVGQRHWCLTSTNTGAARRPSARYVSLAI